MGKMHMSGVPEEIMKPSEIYRENAENCPNLLRASPPPKHQRTSGLVEAAWRSLAEEQEWLDGEVRPIGPST